LRTRGYRRVLFDPSLASSSDGPHHLHGGGGGFDRHLWSATPIASAEGAGVLLARTSPAYEEQYPGTLQGSTPD
jgi:galactose mutarotase-like enzyme